MLLTKKSRCAAEREIQRYLKMGLPSFAAYAAERAGMRNRAARYYDMAAKSYNVRGPEWQKAAEQMEERARHMRKRFVVF